MRKWLWFTLAPILLFACTEVPVKTIRSCSKVVKVELVKSNIFNFFFFGDPYISSTLEDGTKKSISVEAYKKELKEFDEERKRLNYEPLNDIPFMVRVKIREMGREYCRTTYERIK